jgi:hypothetical protein
VIEHGAQRESVNGEGERRLCAVRKEVPLTSKRPLWALLHEHGARCAALTHGERDATNDHNESIQLAPNRSKATVPSTSPSMAVGLTDLAFSCKGPLPAPAVAEAAAPPRRSQNITARWGRVR